MSLLTNLKEIGKNFYSVMQDLGENYIVETPNGEEWTGKLSIEAKTTSTKLMEEREYLMKGTATFPDIEAQTTFRGCYFKRAINPLKTYLMVSTMPEPTDERIGSVFAVECNETVDLAYLETREDEKFNKVTVPVVYKENVRVYFDTTLQKQKRSSDGNFDSTQYFMQMPARFGISEDLVVLRKVFKWNDKTKTNEITKVRYRVEAVTLSMATIDDDNNVNGICDVALSVDTRG